MVPVAKYDTFGVIRGELFNELVVSSVIGRGRVLTCGSTRNQTSGRLSASVSNNPSLLRVSVNPASGLPCGEASDKA